MAKDSGLAAVHAAAASAAGATQEDAPADRAAAAAAVDTAPIVAKASTDQRERIKKITTHAAAEGRRELAEYFAFETDMSAELAIAALEKAPKAEAKPASRLDAAMEGFKPKVDATEAAADQSANLAAGLHAATTRQLAKIGKKPKEQRA